MVWVVVKPGHCLGASELIEHCKKTMAKHMVPRYVEFVDELPKTPTEKVEKFRLKERGVGASTWDTEAVQT